jgi:hypothetical protein
LLTIFEAAAAPEEGHQDTVEQGIDPRQEEGSASMGRRDQKREWKRGRKDAVEESDPEEAAAAAAAGTEAGGGGRPPPPGGGGA